MKICIIVSLKDCKKVRTLWKDKLKLWILAKQATNMGVNLCKYFQPHYALLGGGGVRIGCCCTLEIGLVVWPHV